VTFDGIPIAALDFYEDLEADNTNGLVQGPNYNPRSARGGWVVSNEGQPPAEHSSSGSYGSCSNS
jgi:hypothetical protein